MPVAIVIHVLAAIVWIGGMFFAYMALRPVAASLLEPPARLTLWARVFDRFFPWVWLSITFLLLSGFWMVFAVFGGMAHVGIHVHLMLLVGLVMTLIYAYLYFSPYRLLSRAVEDEDWPAGGGQLNKIRRLVGVNLVLGLLVAVIGSGGRYLQ